MALAGQVAVGSITVGQSRGLAEVAVGSGSVSGDLNADIADSAVGAYSLLVREAPPQDGDAALARLRATFPTLAEVNLQQAARPAGWLRLLRHEDQPQGEAGEGGRGHGGGAGHPGGHVGGGSLHGGLGGRGQWGLGVHGGIGAPGRPGAEAAGRKAQRSEYNSELRVRSTTPS